MNEPEFLAISKLKSLIALPSPKLGRTTPKPAGIQFPMPNFRYHIEPEAVGSIAAMLPLYLMLRPDESTVCITPTGRALGTIRFPIPFTDVAGFLDSELLESTSEQRRDGNGDIIFLRDEATTTTKYIERLHRLVMLTAE